MTAQRATHALLTATAQLTVTARHTATVMVALLVEIARHTATAMAQPAVVQLAAPHLAR
jgi:hypothetical protein